MDRLTPEEIQQHKDWLCEWRSPEEMLQYSNRVADEIGIDRLFNRNNAKFLLEASGAATFSKLRGATRTRLWRPDPPDFELKIGGSVERFEFTEALEAGRERGNEYKETARRMKDEECDIVVYHDSEEEWIKRADDIPGALRNCAERKSMNNYPPGTNLLIYLNTRDFVTETPKKEQIQALFQPCTSSAKDRFEEIWILWKDSIYKVWSHGRPGNQPTPAKE